MYELSVKSNPAITCQEPFKFNGCQNGDKTSPAFRFTCLVVARWMWNSDCSLAKHVLERDRIWIIIKVYTTIAAASSFLTHLQNELVNNKGTKARGVPTVHAMEVMMIIKLWIFLASENEHSLSNIYSSSRLFDTCFILLDIWKWYKATDVWGRYLY